MKEETFLSGEELCKELKEALEISSNETFTGITHELTEAVCQFSHAHHCSNLITTPINTIDNASSIQMLKNLNDNENMFTFPGDLLLHYNNSLKDVGVIKV